MGRPGSKLVQIMQEVNSSGRQDLVDVLFGTVTNISPLTVKVENKFEVDNEFLILTRSVRNTTLTIQEGDTTKTVTVKNALKVNEKVILLRAQEGQRFIILDRL